MGKTRGSARRGIWRNERGESLPLALVALAAGTLLMMPLLGHVSTRFRATARVEEATYAQYTSDAGVEYALWAIAHNDSLRSALMDNPGTAYDLALLETINGATPAVRAVCTSVRDRDIDELPQLPWALWAQSSTRTSTISFEGSGHRVNGPVHSNNQITIAGNGISVHGRVEHVGELSVVGPGHYFVPGPPENPVVGAVANSPIAWDIAEFSDPTVPGTIAAEAAALGQYHVHTTPWDVTTATTVPPGVHYCTAPVSFSGSGLAWPNITVVSTDVIAISGAGLTFTPYVAGLSFFSSKASADTVISITGSGSTGATTFAPNGRIRIGGSGGTIVGAFVGDRIIVSGVGATIELADVPMHNPDTQRCGVFDIESTAGATRTTARITDCDPEGPRVLAWRLD